MTNSRKVVRAVHRAVASSKKNGKKSNSSNKTQTTTTVDTKEVITKCPEFPRGRRPGTSDDLQQEINASGKALTLYEQRSLSFLDKYEKPKEWRDTVKAKANLLSRYFRAVVNDSLRSQLNQGFLRVNPIQQKAITTKKVKRVDPQDDLLTDIIHGRSLRVDVVLNMEDGTIEGPVRVDIVPDALFRTFADHLNVTHKDLQEFEAKAMAFRMDEERVKASKTRPSQLRKKLRNRGVPAKVVRTYTDKEQLVEALVKRIVDKEFGYDDDSETMVSTESDDSDDLKSVSDDIDDTDDDLPALILAKDPSNNGIWLLNEWNERREMQTQRLEYFYFDDGMVKVESFGEMAKGWRLRVDSFGRSWLYELSENSCKLNLLGKLQLIEMFNFPSIDNFNVDRLGDVWALSMSSRDEYSLLHAGRLFGDRGGTVTEHIPVEGTRIVGCASHGVWLQVGSSISSCQAQMQPGLWLIGRTTSKRVDVPSINSYNTMVTPDGNGGLWIGSQTLGKFLLVHVTPEGKCTEHAVETPLAYVRSMHSGCGQSSLRLTVVKKELPFLWTLALSGKRECQLVKEVAYPAHEVTCFFLSPLGGTWFLIESDDAKCWIPTFLDGDGHLHYGNQSQKLSINAAASIATSNETTKFTVREIEDGLFDI